MKDQSKYILYCSYFQLNELVDVNPESGSSFIRSITEPFSDEMRLDAVRVGNWLKLFDLQLHGMEQADKLHASGHASGGEIFEALEKIQAKCVIPIHTEHPDTYQKGNQNVLLVEKNKSYLI